MSTSPTKTYSSSQQFIEERKKYGISLGSTLLTMMLVVYVVIGSGSPGFLLFSWPYVLGFLGFVGLLLFVQTRYMLQQFRLMSVTVTPLGINRHFRNKIAETKWETVRRMQLFYSPSDTLIGIGLLTHRRVPIVLAGLENMDALRQDIEQFAPTTSLRQIKRQRVNWQSSRAPWFIMLGAGAFVGLVVLAGGAGVLQYFNWGIQSFLGVWFLFFNPISRLNVNFRKLEVVLGVYTIVVVLAQIYFYFF